MEKPLLDLDVIKELLLNELLIRVEERTPVDSGNARNNWERTEDGFKNETPYINRLEDGWSDQAPNGMLRLTVEEAQNIFDNIVKKETQ